ncbi:hypothetical protein N2152v2_000317 [Parachlorella kessleri]
MALGFTLPLFIVLAVLSAVGSMLLVPIKALNKPAIELARASYTPMGNTIANTFTAVLLLLLASPVYDAYRLYSAVHKTDREHFDPRISINEAETALSLVLIISDLAALFALRKLGCVMGDKERMAASEAALLKQVKGLQTEYLRVADGGAGAGAKGGGEEALRRELDTLRKQVAAAEERAAEAQEAQLAAEKAQQAAENRLGALKSQAAGLEREYDRLLVEFNHTQRQLAQATGLSVADLGSMGKKDE